MLGESLALIGAFGWVGSAIFLEKASKEVGATAVNIIRLIIAMFFLIIITTLQRGMPLPVDVSKDALKFLTISGLFGLFIGDFFLYRSYIYIGSRITLLIMTFTPIVVSILSFVFLKESFKFIQIIGMITVIGGVCLVISKKEGKESLSKVGFLYATLAMLGESLGIIFTKLGSSNFDSFATIQVRTIPAILAFIAYITFKKEWTFVKSGIFNKKGILYITLGTLIATLGITAIVESMRHTHVGISSTLASTSPVLIIPISILFFNEKINKVEIIGTIIAFIGITLFFVS